MRLSNESRFNNFYNVILWGTNKGGKKWKLIYLNLFNMTFYYCESDLCGMPNYDRPKIMPKGKSRNVELQNAKINAEIPPILTFCIFLYSKKTSKEKMPNYKMPKRPF